MFEAEIMIAGYTLLVATTSVVISKCKGRRKLKSINNELVMIKNDLLKVETEIKIIKAERFMDIKKEVV